MSEGDQGNTETDVSRRAFLKRMAAIAFAVPVVSSFTLDAVAHGVDAHQQQVFANQVTPGQFFSNQGQSVPSGNSQYFPNQTFPYQYGPNQLPQ